MLSLRAHRRVVRRARRAARPLARRRPAPPRRTVTAERSHVDIRCSSVRSSSTSSSPSRPARWSPSSGRTAPASPRVLRCLRRAAPDRRRPHRARRRGRSTTRPRGTFVPPERRPIGVVFQDYLLFAHLTALENVAFGLRARGDDQGATHAPRAAEWLARVGLADHAGTSPARCRAGRRSASPSARALATEPRAAAARRAARRARRRHPRRACAATCAATSHDVRRDAGIMVTHDPRRRLRARRPRRRPRGRAHRPDRHARRGHRPPAVALRRRAGRHQPPRRYQRHGILRLENTAELVTADVPVPTVPPSPPSAPRRSRCTPSDPTAAPATCGPPPSPTSTTTPTACGSASTGSTGDRRDHPGRPRRAGPAPGRRGLGVGQGDRDHDLPGLSVPPGATEQSVAAPITRWSPAGGRRAGRRRAGSHSGAWCD